jgi:hypothetical protein
MWWKKSIHGRGRGGSAEGRRLRWRLRSGTQLLAVTGKCPLNAQLTSLVRQVLELLHGNNGGLL